jgi:hypothetical protein
VSPYPAFTSTSTGYASMPLAAPEQTLANMGRGSRDSGRKCNPVFTGVAPDLLRLPAEPVHGAFSGIRFSLARLRQPVRFAPRLRVSLVWR